jgi:hypothetical protein
MASLIVDRTKRPAGELLHRFLVFGVPHAFPPVVGPDVTGFATACMAPPFHGLIEPAERFVWPSAEGSARGLGLTPLLPRSANLPERNAALYELLAIVDAVRVGQLRERKLAAELLHGRLVGQAS